MSRIPFPQNPQPPREFRIDILVLIVAIVTVGYTFIRFFVDRKDYTQGHAAYRDVNCAVATKHFDRILKGWRLTDIGGYANLAQQEKSECLDFQPALDTEKSGKLSQAILKYKDFISTHPTESILVKTARDRVNSLFEKTEPKQLATADLCPNLTPLSQAQLIPEANTKLPILYMTCAQMYSENKAYEKASELYEAFLDNYPNHTLAPQVKTAWAKSLVAQAEAQGAGTLPTPQLGGRSSSGLPMVTIRNDSPEAMRIVFSGTEGRIEELEKCVSCQTYTGKAPDSCPNQGPVGRYTLQPGEYDVVVKAIRGQRVIPFKGRWSLNSNWIYTNCFYLVTNPVDPPSKP